ncbi:L,D-transpeptidase family protein [Sphingobium subterraneum]|uniref:Lipoprotein-anchoring transpeptidase ErfK/SrfK n=1 Tax=Sphingobium subterraneum TaxID=627688 RepID=A0A841IYS9_9SPHN|nr:L,D-transpeptidase family protein [Sphingobium subterraneum]MBB6124109.1 lipoprotein-anchoring transpeptidase ErfK/SrfK [Sphingobium subterraneum]
MTRRPYSRPEKIAAGLCAVLGLIAVVIWGVSLSHYLAKPHQAASSGPTYVRPAAPTTPAAPAPKPSQTAAATTPSMQPPANSFVVKRILKIDQPFDHGDYVWDDAGVPPGPIVITVDLAAQTLSVFRGGYEIGAAVILYGANDMPTPVGTYRITEKDADHVSNLYHAPMPYMLRLTNDGISIHGSDVQLNAGTHGCIGVPTPFARKLFAQARLSDVVIVTNGKMMDLSGIS